MKKHLWCLLVMVAVVFFATQAAFAIDYVDYQPLSKVVTSTPRDYQKSSTLRMPYIQWAGDFRTIYANGNALKTQPGSIFAKDGINLELFREDYLPKQLDQYIKGESVFLRGTLGTLLLAAEVANKDPRTEIVVFYQESWSNGGDHAVVSKDVKSAEDLKGVWAAQIYGPHTDLLGETFRLYNLQSNDVKIKWVKDITYIDDKSMHPVRAMREDKSVRLAFMIAPDASDTTSKFTVGTGSENSVQGARDWFSTKTANRVTADCIGVRRDFFEANKELVFKIVHGLMVANEDFTKLVKEKDSRKAEYLKNMKTMAAMTLDDPNAIAAVEDLEAGCEMAGWNGNVKFFGNDARNIDKVAAGLQKTFLDLKLMSKESKLSQAQWDYTALSKGLTDISNVELPKFNKTKVAQVVDKAVKSNEKENTMPSIEIYFSKNESTFPAETYHAEFDKVIDLVSTMGGAVISVEGHGNSKIYLESKKAGTSPKILADIKQSSRNLGYARANAVVKSVIEFAKAKGIILNETQFGVYSWGFMKPKAPANCKYDSSGDLDISSMPSDEEGYLNQRVVFKVINVESE